MKPPFDLKAFRARVAAIRSPDSPVENRLAHVVRLRPITSAGEQDARWNKPQHWCRQHVDHHGGHQWSRRMHRETNHPEFSFSDRLTAIRFALKYR